MGPGPNLVLRVAKVVGRRRQRQSTGKEVAHRSGNFRGVGLQREVSGIKKAYDCVWVVAFERLGTGREEERIVLAPHSQETRLMRAEILLESWVQRDVALVITEQVELQLIGAGPGQ